MNQSQFVHKLMEHLFGWDYEYLNDADCSYELALGMIKEKLVELFETINTILNCGDPLNRNQVAKELLPTDIEGCFFGSEEYDDYYFEDLEETKKVLDKVFAYEKTAEDGHCFDNFYYQSYW